jgi:hypothetical protein
MAKEKFNVACQENYRTEYREVAANHRFFASLRFGVAAFAATLQSALFTFYNQASQQALTQARTTSILFVGIATMAAIAIIEQRNIALFRVMIRRGKELEFNLGLFDGQFSRLSEPELVRPKGWRRILTHAVSIRFIYGVIFALWITLLVLSFIKQPVERRLLWQSEAPEAQKCRQKLRIHDQGTERSSLGSL